MKHIEIESLESRQLLAADIALDTGRLLFSGVKNQTSATQIVTIRNEGTSSLKIHTGGLSIAGTDYNKFKLSGLPTLPKTILPGASISIKVAFKPTVAGVKSATLKIKSNDLDTPTASVALRGLGTDGLYDSKEPSLQRIVDLFQIPVKTGDTNIATNRIDGPAANDSVEMQTLVKAGEGPVAFELLACYTGASNPAGKFGWYAPGDITTKTELFTIPSTDVQVINPRATGATSFEPGESPFALYSSWPVQPYQDAFSENAFNTWEINESARGKYRYYPLKTAGGAIVPNAYVLGIEEAKNSDFQDAVMIVRNVAKYVPPVLPPVDPTTPTDPTPLPDTLGLAVLDLPDIKVL